MEQFPALKALISELGRLPGIGPKSAQRIALHLLKASREEAEALSRAIVGLKEKVGFCKRCFGISEGPLCGFCQDEGRDKSTVCVVEDPSDVFSIERTGDFRGLYHVLMGVISPLKGMGPGDLKVEELMRRVREEGVREVIVATNPSMEGEATALHLAQALKPLGVRVTRLAHGIPVGGALEYLDQMTLSRSLEGRREL